MKLILTVLFFSISPFLLKAQINFKSEPTKTELGDSVLYKLKGNEVYNYFNQKFDNEIFLLGKYNLLPMDIIFKQKNIQYEQIASLDKFNNGNLLVYFDGKKLINYQIRDHKVDGVAICYYGLENKIAIVSMFKNGNLDGVSTFFDKEGNILEVVLFKKGKYKKHLHTWKAKTRKSNDKYKGSNPFLID